MADLQKIFHSIVDWLKGWRLSGNRDSRVENCKSQWTGDRA